MNKPVGHLGGKDKTVGTLVKMIPYHNKYIEIFGGGASLLFAKRKSYKEIYNDIDSLLVNFFLVLRDQSSEFFKMLDRTPISVEIFERFSGHWEQGLLVLPDKLKTLEPVEQAVTYFLIKRNSYGNKMCEFDGANRSGCRYRIPAREVVSFRRRLKDVIIENKHYPRIIERYDGWDSFFYADPPYYNEHNERWYQVDWTDAEHVRLFSLLKKMKGKWLLSYGDHPFIRDLYKDYKIKEIKTHFSVTHTEKSDANKEVIDLAITNY